MILSGSSSLIDSSSNENGGVIYLKSGASLIISGDGTLKIITNKNMAINEIDWTFLTINGRKLDVMAYSGETEGIYLRKGMAFNDGNYSYNGPISFNHALDSEGTIEIRKGKYALNPGYGKGIQSQKYLYLDQEYSKNFELIINIDTSNEVIEAERIIIYSGNI